jgi:hypothetical protein
MPPSNAQYTAFQNITAWQPSMQARWPVSLTPGNPLAYAPAYPSTGVPSTSYPIDNDLMASALLNVTASSTYVSVFDSYVINSEFDKWYLADQYARIVMDREQVAAYFFYLHSRSA